MSYLSKLLLATTFLVLPRVAAEAQVRVTPTNVPGVAIVEPSTVPLDVTGASNGELSQNAVPPRPDPAQAPAAYQKWMNAVAGPQKHEPVEVTPTNQHNGPSLKHEHGELVQGSESTITANSSNWSGTSVISAGNKISTLEAIIGEFTVPQAHAPFGTTSGNYYSSQWPGIDGNGSSDVLQAGTEVDWLSGTPFYSAWIEWYPYSETRVSSPKISPGDLIFVEVWSVSTTVGYAYFYNYSTNVSAEYQLTAPAGTTLKGQSVEWIVERPGVGGGLANLTNYISSGWPYGIAWNYQSSAPTYYWQGNDPGSGGTLEKISMLDNNGKAISSATLENFDFLWFTNYGSSQ